MIEDVIEGRVKAPPLTQIKELERVKKQELA